MARCIGLDTLKRWPLPVRSTLFVCLVHKHFLPICLAVALIIRLSWILLIATQPVSDTRWYYERGLDFAAGRGYSVSAAAYWPPNLIPVVLTPHDEIPSAGRPTAFWPVGYPAFLGILFFMIGPSLLAARLANVLLGLGVLFLSYSIAKTLFSSEIVGRITLLVLALYPQHIAYTALLGSETLFLWLLLLGVVPLLVSPPKAWLAFAAGLIFGLACLVKPQAIFVPAIILAALPATDFKRAGFIKYTKLAAIIYVAVGLTILPWLIRNYKVFNTFIFISNNGGYNLLVGNNPDATGGYVFNEKITAMLSEAKDEPGRDREAFKKAIAYMANHPLETIKLWPRKFWYLYGKDVEGISWNEMGIPATPDSGSKMTFYILKVVAQAYYMFIVMAFLLAIIVLGFGHKGQAGSPSAPLYLGLWIIAYFTMVHLFTFGDSRFHFPVMPWMVMYSGILAEMLVKADNKTISGLKNGLWQGSGTN